MAPRHKESTLQLTDLTNKTTPCYSRRIHAI